MKILFVATDRIPHIGGKSTHIYDLMDGFKYNGHNATIISATDFSVKTEYIIKCFLLPFWLINYNSYSYLYTLFSLIVMANMIKKYCKKNRVDIISAQDVYAAKLSYTAAKKYGIPIVLTMHTYFAIEPTLDNSNIKYNTKKAHKIFLNEIKALDITQAIVAVDTRIKNHVKKSITENKSYLNIPIETIPNFTNLKRFYAIEIIKKNQLRDKYGLPRDRFIVICARRLVEKNGVIYAVKAMEKLDRNSTVFLAIVGDGPQHNTIADYISSHDLNKRVILLGEFENSCMNELYQLSDVSVVPSITVNGLQEATSVSAIEAMACGLTVIASNIGGLRELINDGENGYLVPEKDEVAIANKLSFLENNIEISELIGLNAIEYIRNYHSHLKAAEDYLLYFAKASKY